VVVKNYLEKKEKEIKMDKYGSVEDTSLSFLLNEWVEQDKPYSVSLMDKDKNTLFHFLLTPKGVLFGMGEAAEAKNCYIKTEIMEEDDL
jgi:hypothetical protein|tara:strand:+ start:765 stop:1031 length:267 start_codon:yes stop_codon:yes gene_type:complete